MQPHATRCNRVCCAICCSARWHLRAPCSQFGYAVHGLPDCEAQCCVTACERVRCSNASTDSRKQSSRPLVAAQATAVHDGHWLQLFIMLFASGI